MTALQIRNVPDDIREALVERARARGQSLQAFLLSVVEDEARRSSNLGLLARFSDRSDGSRLTSAELAAETEQLRAERDGGRVEANSGDAQDAG